jgi:hypothetical protein
MNLGFPSRAACTAILREAGQKTNPELPFRRQDFLSEVRTSSQKSGLPYRSQDFLTEVETVLYLAL